MPANKKPVVIQAKNLTYTRDGEEILHDFSFDIHAGDYVAILGPNGGGKSTLLKLMIGLIKPSNGSIAIKHGTRLSYVPQHGGLIESHIPATVEEIVISMQKKKDVAYAQTIITALKLKPLRKRAIATLSGGERQRTLIARALATKPDILFFDEPTDSLDTESQAAFHHLRQQYNTKHHTTILYVTHDAHSIAKETNAALCIKHDLVCHGDHACLVRGAKLRNLYHTSKQELEHHHHIDYV